MRVLRTLLFFAVLMSTAAWAQQAVFEHIVAATNVRQSSTSVSTIDATGNVYIAGISESGVLVEKVTPAGVVAWRYTDVLSTWITAESHLEAIAVNSAGQVFLTSNLTDPFAGAPGYHVLALDVNGIPLWNDTQPILQTHGLVFDASGNPLIIDTGGVSGFEWVKHNATSGAVILRSPQNINVSDFVSLTAKGNGYMYFLRNEHISPPFINVDKIDMSTGNALWTSTIVPSNGLDSFTPSTIVVLSGGDTVIAGHGSAAGTNKVVFERLRGTDGSIVFTKSYSGPQVAGLTLVGLALGPGDNLYWCATEGTAPGYTYAARLDTAGNVVWNYEDHNIETATGIQPTSFGGAFVSAYEGSGSQLAMWVVMPRGNLLWRVRPAPSPYGKDLWVDSNNVASVVGTSSFPLQQRQFGVLKVNVSEQLVAKTDDSPNGTVDTQILSSDKDSSGNVYTAQKQGSNICIVKYSAAGATLWTKIVNAKSDTWTGTPIKLRWSPLGQVSLIANLDHGPLGVVKVDAAAGSVTWAVTYPQPTNGSIVPVDVMEDSVGNVDAGVTFQPNGSAQQMGVIQFSTATGNANWLRKYGGSTSAMTALVVDNQDHIIFSGPATTSANRSGIGTVKLSSTGGLLYNDLVDVTGTACDGGALQVDSSRNVFVAGAIAGYLFATKYNEAGQTVWIQGYAMTGYQKAGAPKLLLNLTSNVMYLVAEISGSNGLDVATLKISPSSGSKLWQDIYNGANNNLDRCIAADIDPYGDLVEAVYSRVITGLLSGDTLIRKFDSAAGTLRFGSVYYGTLASSNLYPTELQVGTDDQIFLFGTAPSDTGGYTRQSFFSKFSDTNAPVCHDDSYSISAGSTLNVSAPGVLANDEDLAGNAPSLQTFPAHAQSFVLNPDGSFSYTPVAGFTGTDTFSYFTYNNFGTSNVAVVTVTVQ